MQAEEQEIREMKTAEGMRDISILLLRRYNVIIGAGDILLFYKNCQQELREMKEYQASQKIPNYCAKIKMERLEKENKELKAKLPPKTHDDYYGYYD